MLSRVTWKDRVESLVCMSVTLVCGAGTPSSAGINLEDAEWGHDCRT